MKIKSLKTPLIFTAKQQALLILSLTFLNLILLLFNIGAIDIPKRTSKEVVAPGKMEISQIEVGKEIEKAGYKTEFTNPRYEFDEERLMDSFKVDVTLTNISFKPSIKPIFNCDIVDKGEKILEGSGVFLNESHELFPGESHEYTVIVGLEIDYTQKGQGFTKDDVNPFPDRRVSSCAFTPTGSYDPNIAVKVNFE